MQAVLYPVSSHVTILRKSESSNSNHAEISLYRIGSRPGLLSVCQYLYNNTLRSQRVDQIRTNLKGLIEKNKAWRRRVSFSGSISKPGGSIKSFSKVFFLHSLLSLLKNSPASFTRRKKADGGSSLQIYSFELTLLLN